MQLQHTAARAAVLAACAALFFLSSCRSQPAGAPGLVLHSDTASATYGAVDVRGVDAATLRGLERAAPGTEQWHTFFSVHTADAAARDSSSLPLLGRYSVQDGRLRFTPRFAPAPGQSYRVRFDGAAAARVAGVSAPAKPLTLDTTWHPAPVSGSGNTSVVQIYPSSDSLPVNLLRIYVHFSAPMSMGEAYRRVQLLDAQGRVVPDAFLVVSGEKELWDAQRRRLTLLFDPGRIKRDLRPNLEMGLPLREGESFTLAIDSAWQDAHGRPLLSSFRKQFTVLAADRVSPRTEQWQITAPRAGTRAALVLGFPEPLDQALLQRLLAVRTAAGNLIPGVITVDRQETRWSFTPDAPWQAGAHVIDVGTELEDVAGNSLRRLFDTDRAATAAPLANAERVQLSFTVR